MPTLVSFDQECARFETSVGTASAQVHGMPAAQLADLGNSREHPWNQVLSALGPRGTIEHVWDGFNGRQAHIRPEDTSFGGTCADKRV